MMTWNTIYISTQVRFSPVIVYEMLNWVNDPEFVLFRVSWIWKWNNISLLLKSLLIKISVHGRKAFPKLRSFHWVLVSSSKHAFSQKRSFHMVQLMLMRFQILLVLTSGTQMRNLAYWLFPLKCNLGKPYLPVEVLTLPLASQFVKPVQHVLITGIFLLQGGQCYKRLQGSKNNSKKEWNKLTF